MPRIEPGDCWMRSENATCVLCTLFVALIVRLAYAAATTLTKFRLKRSKPSRTEKTRMKKKCFNFNFFSCLRQKNGNEDASDETETETCSENDLEPKIDVFCWNICYLALQQTNIFFAHDEKKYFISQNFDIRSSLIYHQVMDGLWWWQCRWHDWSKGRGVQVLALSIFSYLILVVVAHK